MITKTKYTPPDAVSNNIVRGKVLKHMHSRNSVAAAETQKIVEKSSTYLNDGFDLDAIKYLYNNLTKLEKSVDFKKQHLDGGPTEEIIKFYASGGTAGLAWARQILKQENILKSYVKDIDQGEFLQEENHAFGKIQVAKAVNTELMQATFIVLVPNETDLHGDIISEDEVRKACHNFNKFSMQANLFHLVETKTFEFIESYCTATDFILGDKFVQKGTWLATIQCLDEGLWELIKSGEINGLSIGALALTENLKDNE